MDRSAEAEVLRFDGFRFDLIESCLLRESAPAGCEPLILGSRAAALLALLLERAGRLVTKDEIFAAVWPGMAVEEANLTMQVSALRRILDQGREQGSCIQTVTGRGYRFVARVTRAAPSRSPDVTLPGANGNATSAGDDPQAQAAGDDHTQKPTGAAPPRARYRRRSVVMIAVAAGLCLTVALVAIWNWRSAPARDESAARRLSIVILPFANLNPDPHQQYLADAVTEDLTSELARNDPTHVISHSTALSYRDKPIGLKQIGRELGVRYVLEGGVQRSGDRMRVDVALIDAASDQHLWADEFDRGIGDLFALEDEIARRVANTLSVTLEAVEAHRRGANPDALDFVLQGRAAFGKRNFANALGAFEHALALDPHFVEAQTWLARLLVLRALRQQSATAAADIAHADKLAEQALAAVPLYWLAHYVKGQVLRARHRCDEAIPEFRKVVTLNPLFQAAYANLGWCEFRLGSLDEVIPRQLQVIGVPQADPFFLSMLYWRIGVVELVQAHIREAIAMFEKSRSVNPGLGEVHAYLAAAYGLRDRAEPAAAELAEARRLSRDGRYSSLARLAATEYFGVPSMRALFEKTYLAGLRKAGIPEE